MNVLGIEIDQVTIDQAFQWFPPHRSFTFTDFQVALTRHGVPFSVSDRAADRILQKARKARHACLQWRSLEARQDRGDRLLSHPLNTRGRKAP